MAHSHLMSTRELQLLQLKAMKLIHHVCIKHNIKYYMIGGTLLGAVRHNGFIPWDDDIDIAMMRDDFEKFKNIFCNEFDTEKYFLQNYDTDKYLAPALMRLCIKDTIVDLPSEYHLKNVKNTYIDIFPLDNIPDEESKQKRHAKRLATIDRKINLILYHKYEKDKGFRLLLKKGISFIYSFQSLTRLQRARIKEMSKYDGIETKNVCSTTSHYGYARQIMDRNIYGNPVLLKFEDAELYAPEKWDQYLIHLFGKNFMALPPREKRDVPHGVFRITPYKKYSIGYTCGVFDMFHIGHLNILRQAKEQCDFLIVGVSTDELVQSYKHKTPIIPYAERAAIVEACQYVDKVVPQTNRDKMEAFNRLHFDVMFVGDDWKGNELFNLVEKQLKSSNADVVYFAYTKHISSTKLREKIQSPASTSEK